MSGYDFAIVYIDCDNFKLLNDTRGHAAGDSVLREVVDYLRQVVRPADMIARLGGDEFAIVLRDCKNDDLGQIISRIRKFEKHGVTLSCGWSTSNETDPLSAADRRMYECKQSSR